MTDTIGATAQVGFSLFNKTLDAKVDTGATTCCLHGMDVQINHKSGTVTFTNPDLSPNIIQVPLQQVVDVHSADNGASERPIVVMDVSLEGKHFKDVQFNINDRSNMDVKVLIGQNLIKQGGFVVDVSEQQEAVALDPIEVNTNMVVDPEVKDIQQSAFKHTILRNITYDASTDSYNLTITADALSALLQMRLQAE